ncbi:MAG: hypothetical protein CMA63_05290 [Euryarchaeota archaeon]|nr:hypothetical protein [Euryarchaeota archaeon]|tara:strand:- start:2018 stop:2272 length:255 start_codon:yes stop_codon:yes gene_type:complete
MTHQISKKIVKLSILEYDDVLVPLPLLVISLGLMTSFTYLFQILAIVSLPLSLLFVYSIFTGDVTMIESNPSSRKNPPLFDEEE